MLWQRYKKSKLVFGISRLTKDHQYKIRFRRRLTQTLVFPKFSYTVIPDAWSD